MHRIVMEVEKDMVVDHINRVKHDNRKDNLRICSQKENSRNLKISINNTSGVTGVCFNKSNNRWRATIGINGKRIHLGYFANKQDAIEARLKAELELFGEYSPNYEKLTQNESSQPSKQQNTQ